VSQIDSMITAVIKNVSHVYTGTTRTSWLATNLRLHRGDI